MTAHPNEIPLAFRTPTGTLLPTRDFGKVVAAEVERGTMTDAKREALAAQVDRIRNATLPPL